MNKNPHLALAKPVRSAWRVEGADEPLTVVEYQDGTGQAFNEDGDPLYVEGVPFQDEPAGHLDPDPGVEVSQLA